MKPEDVPLDWLAIATCAYAETMPDCELVRPKCLNRAIAAVAPLILAEGRRRGLEEAAAKCDAGDEAWSAAYKQTEVAALGYYADAAQLISRSIRDLAAEDNPNSPPTSDSAEDDAGQEAD